MKWLQEVTVLYAWQKMYFCSLSLAYLCMDTHVQLRFMFSDAWSTMTSLFYTSWKLHHRQSCWMHCALTIHKHPSETTHCIGRSVKDRPIKYQRMTLGNKVVNYNIPGWSNEHFWGSSNHWICQCLSGSYHWCDTSFSLSFSIDHWTSTKTKETKVRVGETSASVINIPNGALLQMIPHLHLQ